MKKRVENKVQDQASSRKKNILASEEEHDIPGQIRMALAAFGFPERLWVKSKSLSGNVNLGSKPSCQSVKSSQSVPREERTRVPTYPSATSQSHWRE